MGNKKEKSGFFKKILNVISGQNGDSPSPNPESQGKYLPQEKDPLDLRFVKKFTANGGHFIYCENSNDLRKSLRNIVLEEGLSNVYSVENFTKEVLEKIEIEAADTVTDCEAVCSTCEALVAFNGGIMITEFQSGGKKLSELPIVHIVIGKTTQMVENLHAGMARINNKFRHNIPSQISTLKGSQDEAVLQAALDHNSKRTLYLLLLEDEGE